MHNQNGPPRAYPNGLNQTGWGCPIGLRNLFARSTSVKCHSNIVASCELPVAGKDRSEDFPLTTGH